MRTAAMLRADGYTVAFFGGRVHIWKPGQPAMGQAINRGQWMKESDGWEAESDSVLQRMQATRAICYCGQCGITACDFCQGVRNMGLTPSCV